MATTQRSLKGSHLPATCARYLHCSTNPSRPPSPPSRQLKLTHYPTPTVSRDPTTIDWPPSSTEATIALEFVRTLRLVIDTFEQTPLLFQYTKPESLYMNTSTRSALSMHISGSRIKLSSISRIWGTSFPFFAFQDLLLYIQISSYGPANRQTTPGFLVSVTDLDARTGFSNQPRTAAEFAECFRKSPQGQANSAEVHEYPNRFVLEVMMKRQRTSGARGRRSQREVGTLTSKWVFVTFS